MIDIRRSKIIFKSGVSAATKFQRREPSFREILPEFPFNTLYDRWKEAHMPKPSSIRSAVSTELQLVTDRHRQIDRQTDTLPWLVPTLAQHGAGKSSFLEILEKSR